MEGTTAAPVGQLTRDMDAPSASTRPVAPAPSQSVVDALLQPLQDILGTNASSLDLPEVEHLMEPVPSVVVEPLPAKNLGTLQGGQ